MFKRLWAVLIALALMSFPLGALAEAAELPEDGTNGFDLVDSRAFPLYNAMVYRYAHRRTGAEVIYIQNDDTNRVFNMSFHTQAIDNTGLPHVFEHAATNGSDKYPSRDLFMSLMYGSYNTYMNAHTAQTCTYYPVSSLSEDQLLRYADLYVDCCLHPMILKDEAIYRSEAWRYRLDTPEDDLTLEGTVYSEMLGSLTLNKAQIYNARRASLPGSLVGNVSGGDPDCIPDMTYEMLRDYHAKYYHPSNSVTWLYGKLDHFEDFLKLLDDAFAPYDREAFELEDPGYQPLTAPVTQECAFPVEAGSNTDNAAVAWYCFVCPGLKDDAELSQVMDLFATLIGDSASPMNLALRKALPSGSFGTGFYCEGPDAVVIFIAQNINREDVPTFRQIVDDGIADAAENGFSDDLVDAVNARVEISCRLATESDAIGFDLIESMMQEYFSFSDPWRYIEDVAALDNLKSWHTSGRYAELARQWLVGNPRTALVTTYPDPGRKEEKDAALAARLSEIKANMDPGEIDAIVASSHLQPVSNPDTPAMIQALTAVTVPTLPEEAPSFTVVDRTDENNIRYLSACAEVEDIAQVHLMLDTAAVPQDDLHWLQLYVDLLGNMDTARHTWDQLPMLVGRYLCGFDTNLYSKVIEAPFTPKLQMKWAGLDADQPAAFDLLRELLYETQFDDASRLRDNLSRAIASRRTAINASPLDTAMRRALGHSFMNYRYSEYLNGLDYYAFLNDTLARLETDPEGVRTSLEGIRETLNNASGAIVEVAGSAQSITLNEDLAGDWLKQLNHRPVEKAVYDLPVPAAREAMIVDSAVQYNVVALSNDDLGLESYDPMTHVLGRIISDAYLIPRIRDQYGAYGADMSCNNYGMSIDTYRDPNIAQSFEAIDELPDFMDALPDSIDQETLDAYIMSVYTSYARSGGALSGAMEAIDFHAMGLPDDFTLKCMKTLKTMTPESLRTYAPAVRKLVEAGARFTAGGAVAINAEAERYDVILNPFGADE